MYVPGPAYPRPTTLAKTLGAPVGLHESPNPLGGEYFAPDHELFKKYLISAMAKNFSQMGQMPSRDAGTVTQIPQSGMQPVGMLPIANPTTFTTDEERKRQMMMEQIARRGYE